ncbi:MAG: hypothetical protein KDA32_02940 [Phycisphaerales bacterium]|nr:hypothetical protein [Phycisphaerales bacterium]
MQLTESNVVLIGAFNASIVQPPWLIANKVVDPVDECTAKIELNNRAETQWRFSLDELDWRVSGDRIVIGSGRLRSPAPYYEKLLELLPHTPLRAVGINFKLRQDMKDWTAPIPSLPNQEAMRSHLGDIIITSTATRSRQTNKTQVSLTLEATEEEVTLDANFHRGVDGREMALHALTEFESDWEYLGQLIRLMTSQVAS